MVDDVNYFSYLLRLWCAEEGGEMHWRASVESVRSRERTTFRSLAQLYAFLEAQTAAQDGPHSGEVGDVDDGVY